MSVEALTWAFRQTMKHSSAKFVLVALANCASTESMEAYPSVAHLADATGQDRKTVLENLKRLRELGLIEDLGLRKGATGQVVVYRLKSSENGTVKESQKRNSTENGTVPFLDGNSPVFPPEQSRFSLKESRKRDTEPSEPSRNRKSNQKKKKAPACAVARPEGVSEQTWGDWLIIRKSKHAPVTETALAGIRREAAKAGVDIAEALRTCCERGWGGFKAEWLKPNERAGPVNGIKPSAAADFRNKTYTGTALDDLPADLRPS